MTTEHYRMVENELANVTVAFREVLMRTAAQETNQDWEDCYLSSHVF